VNKRLCRVCERLQLICKNDAKRAPVEGTVAFKQISSVMVESFRVLNECCESIAVKFVGQHGAIGNGLLPDP